MTDTLNDHYATDAVNDVVALAQRAANPVQLTPGERYAVVVPEGGQLAEIDLDLDEFRDHPRRKTGNVNVHAIDSFADYFARHYREGESEVWADVINRRITGILNAHENGPDGKAGWRDHRVVFDVAHTDAWRAWLGVDGKMLPQREFAEFLEDNATDIREPAAAVMLEIAQTIEGTNGSTFESGTRLSTGERRFVYRENVNAKAGEAGHLDVPERITLGLRPFEGAAVYAVGARFRYRINGGQLTLGVRLDRPEDIVTEAFEDVIVTLGAALPDAAAITRGGIPRRRDLV